MLQVAQLIQADWLYAPEDPCISALYGLTCTLDGQSLPYKSTATTIGSTSVEGGDEVSRINRSVILSTLKEPEASVRGSSDHRAHPDPLLL